MHVTAKPSSFQCNLKCDYCFYLEKESQFTHEKWMDDSTLKEFIKQLFTINNAMQAKNVFLMHYKRMAFY